MSTKPGPAALPPAVAQILATLGARTGSEEGLYLRYARLDAWQRADLGRYFQEDDYWRLFRAVGRRLGVRKAKE